MADTMLRVQIIDSTNEEDECYEHFVEVDVPKEDIMTAIGVFYPTATDIAISVVEVE